MQVLAMLLGGGLIYLAVLVFALHEVFGDVIWWVLFAPFGWLLLRWMWWYLTTPSAEQLRKQRRQKR